MQKIIPFLWFDSNAEEAVNFYLSIFKDAKIIFTTRYGEAGPRPAGTVLTINFELFGQEFAALNGGPVYQFTPAVSFLVNCDTQAEIDEYWDKLLEGGTPDQCGWLKDKYGVSWQIVPAMMDKLLNDGDPEKANRMMEAMLKMIKLDIAELQRAYDGK